MLLFQRQDLAQHGGFVAHESGGGGAFFEEEEVGGEAVGVQGGLVGIEFGHGEDVWLLQAAADFEAMAPWFVGEGIGGLFGDKFHKVRHAGGVDFQGDE